MWQAWSKNLASIQPGIGHTEREAIDVVKANIASYLTALIGGREKVAIPWTEITGFAAFGSRVVWALVKGVPGPDGKLPEEPKSVEESIPPELSCAKP